MGVGVLYWFPPNNISLKLTPTRNCSGFSRFFSPRPASALGLFFISFRSFRIKFLLIGRLFESPPDLSLSPSHVQTLGLLAPSAEKVRGSPVGFSPQLEIRSCFLLGLPLTPFFPPTGVFFPVLTGSQPLKCVFGRNLSPNPPPEFRPDRPHPHPQHVICRCFSGSMFMTKTR